MLTSDLCDRTMLHIATVKVMFFKFQLKSYLLEEGSGQDSFLFILTPRVPPTPGA